ncbi:MAG: hypothetical protein AAB565_00915 [Patescibacteria group bacterium]
MGITERQTGILNSIITEYINSAHPISSQLLEEKYDFGIRPAAIRIEMQKLTDNGYLIQPHTSSGRVPTDKGYRLFVDRVLEKNFTDENFDDNFWEDLKIDDTLKFIQSLTRSLAEHSSNLALSYLPDEGILWKEGWEEILREPEFREEKFVFNFTQFLKDIEENIDNLKVNSRIKIYIGKESPFPKIRDFSIIISKCHFPNKKEGIVSILGPKRMAYEKNISLINSLTKLLDSF